MQNTEGTIVKNEVSGSGISFSIFIFITVLVSLLGSMVLTAVSPTDSVIGIVVSYLFNPIAMVAVIIMMVKGTKRKLLFAVNVQKCKWQYFIYALILSAGMFMGLGGVNGLFSVALGSLGVNVGGVGNIPLDNAGYYILFTVVIAVIPAIVEESFFRGLILGGAKKAGVVFGALMTALLFSLYHRNLSQLIYQFIYGAGLCFLTVKAGSSLPAMLAHFLNNFVVLTLRFCGVSDNILLLPWVIAVGAILIVAFTFLMIFPTNKKQSIDSEINVETARNNKLLLKKDRKMFLITASVGIAVCVLFVVLNAISWGSV